MRNEAGVSCTPTGQAPQPASEDGLTAEFPYQIPTGVQVQASRHCEVVVRGFDECLVLDRLTTWVRKRRYDIEIVGLQWRTQWVPDPRHGHSGDGLAEFTATMQFKTGAQLDPNWETA